MNKSKDSKTQEFIDNIEMLDGSKFQILSKMRDIVLDHYPSVKEKIMYGGIIFTSEEEFGGIFVYQNHLSFEFSYGYKFKDSENLLEGKGKFRRHLKIQSLKDIETKKVDYFVKQAKSLG